jgi:hypothetical protein
MNSSSCVASLRGVVAALGLSTLALVATLGFAASNAVAAEHTPTTALMLDQGARPAAVPDDYLVTPNGYFHPSCVHEIAADERIRADGRVVDAQGMMHMRLSCAYPHFTADGTRIEANAGGPSKAPVINGWVAFSDTDSSAPTAVAGSIAANFTVPSAPSKSGGQVVYFFPGLEQVPNVVTIVQPVLGWNAFGDHAWTIASWNCCVNGTTNYSSPVSVNVGDTIHGLATGNCTTSSVCDTWLILSEDVTTGQSTTLTTSAYGQAFNWFFGGVLEVYSVSSCNMLPANGSISFQDIEVRDISGNLLAPVWLSSVQNVRPQCTYSVQNTPSSTTISFGGRSR